MSCIFSGRLVCCLYTLAPCIYLQILNGAILFSPLPPILSRHAAIFSFQCSPFYLCMPHFSFCCLVLYFPLAVHLILLCLYVPLPSLVFLSILLHPNLCLRHTTWTLVPGANAWTDPVCDHLGGDCHLPSVSSHLHLHFLLPTGPADRSQHHPQEPLYQPLYRRAALPHWYRQDRIPCKLLWYTPRMIGSHQKLRVFDFYCCNENYIESSIIT